MEENCTIANGLPLTFCFLVGINKENKDETGNVHI